MLRQTVWPNVAAVRSVCWQRGKTSFTVSIKACLDFVLSRLSGQFIKKRQTVFLEFSKAVRRF
jgi:hypothetical protein